MKSKIDARERSASAVSARHPERRRRIWVGASARVIGACRSFAALRLLGPVCHPERKRRIWVGVIAGVVGACRSFAALRTAGQWSIVALLGLSALACRQDM